MRRLEASLRRATPKGHETFISRTAPHQGLAPTSSPPCVQDTLRHPQSGQYDPAGQPYRSFRGLLDHLATLTRNQVRYTGTQVTIAMLTEPTSTQRQAFQLLGTTIPLTLK